MGEFLGVLKNLTVETKWSVSGVANTIFDGLVFVNVDAAPLASPRMGYHGKRIEQSIRKMRLKCNVIR